MDARIRIGILAWLDEERLAVKGRHKGKKIRLKCHYLIGTQRLTKLNLAKGSICRGFDHVKIFGSGRNFKPLRNLYKTLIFKKKNSEIFLTRIKSRFNSYLDYLTFSQHSRLGLRHLQPTRSKSLGRITTHANKFKISRRVSSWNRDACKKLTEQLFIISFKPGYKQGSSIIARE